MVLVINNPLITNIFPIRGQSNTIELKIYLFHNLSRLGRNTSSMKKLAFNLCQINLTSHVYQQHSIKLKNHCQYIFGKL